ncbi:MAG: class I SAM-dependent methyltransferase [Nitrospirae bacterium]|jgi:hypothetical protein|nr:class I SAM-dependent methyltransferase [Nitrospirota bacterium]
MRKHSYVDTEVINEKSLIAVEFTLKWKSLYASHVDCFYTRKLNLWRDLLPENIYETLIGKHSEKSLNFKCKEFFSSCEYDNDSLFEINQKQFDRFCFFPLEIFPQSGRFYPKGVLKGLPDIFKGNQEPFRCAVSNETNIIVDFNHPLSGKEPALTIFIHEIRKKSGETGGECTDWIDTVIKGPGMQARWNNIPTDFFKDNPFSRADENNDILFYENPRFVSHVDKMARTIISGIYGNILKDGMKVLDLMSSWQSHMPGHVNLDSLTGIGLNKEEMELNFQLNEHIVHNLNLNPVLPFNNNEFDAVVCSLSIEYLIKPFEVFEEVARVLKPDGYFVITFSNRWFPPKVIRIWTEIYEFERMGLVLEYFINCNKFKDLHTYSMRGLPRPFDDKYFPEFPFSDPVYSVWGKKL